MTSTVEELLDRLYFGAESESEKGDRFERFVERFLQVDLQWSHRFSQVWRWMDWPGRDGRPDTGVDLVAEERATGEMVAVQCKFYDPRHTLSKADIDSFLSASGKSPFAQRLIVSTTDHWGHNAEQAVVGQQVPVQRLRLEDLRDSSIDWSRFDPAVPEMLQVKRGKHLLPHQVKALDAVVAGFDSNDRGTLIMACGTGKTFTSLRVAERLVPPGGSVLFCVPSIALLSQSLREWSREAEVPQRQFAVCSDSRAGRRGSSEADEDMTVVDLPLPATTDPAKLSVGLAARTGRVGPEGITVVFTTYQSMEVIAEAQRQGAPRFDLIVCDEAHRTTGITAAGAEASAFLTVHDDGAVGARRRLYMTATPRLYGGDAKFKGREAQAVLASMDDELIYGPQFHRLGFGEAVSDGLLSDYKVLVLAVDETSVARTFQTQMAEDSELRLGDAAKIVGCWNGLAKRGQAESGFGDDHAPMQRAVAFARTIADSKAFTARFRDVVQTYGNATEGGDVLATEVEHVDGTSNILVRNARLDWLRDDTPAGTCRVLSNARCLSEGVDVPALDAVMFLSARRSQVDIVQSVGRVMRRADGKRFGYIILPVGIPAGIAPEVALRDNSRYSIIWEVLQALRAHDERFEAMINKIDLNAGRDDRVQVIGVGGGPEEDGAAGAVASAKQLVLDLPQLDEWRDAIYAKIVDKVGSRRYWDRWAEDVVDIADAHRTRIAALLSEPGTGVYREFDAFLTGLRGNLNDGISEGDAIDMLAQHLITRPVFDALFEGYSFAEHNPVARVMQDMLTILDRNGLQAENASLEGFYESVRMRVRGIDNAAGKQRIVMELYENFFKVAFAKTASSLGIVYTPTEIVDFILRAADDVLRAEFGTSLSDEDVHILDPFTGTGTFITRLLQSGLIRPEDLARKYANELHANEILLLAYYIACINIESAYHDLAGGQYEPFPGAVLVDTFQASEAVDVMDQGVFPVNHARVQQQNHLPIQVIVGNPPYSSGQESENDNNRNVSYRSLDASIRATYAARSLAKNKNTLYDSYIRAIKWATGRIGDRGVVAFITNGAWIYSNSADGMRQTLAEECSSIYVMNLKGNARTAGEQRKREGGGVFAEGAKTTVAIVVLVKNSLAPEQGVVSYFAADDYLDRQDKLRLVDQGSIDVMPWRRLMANNHGDWIDHRDDVFATYMTISAKDDAGSAVLKTHSQGLKTNRDAWVYNFSQEALTNNVLRTIDTYNGQVADFQEQVRAGQVREPRNIVDDFIDTDSSRISWSGGLKQHLVKGRTATWRSERRYVGAYRPFVKEHAYFETTLNERVYRLPSLFPTADHRNCGIYVAGVSSATPFVALATDQLPNLDLSGAGSHGQFFPRWTYARTDDLNIALDGPHDEPDVNGYVRVDNVSAAAISTYRDAYGADVTTDDVFDYMYGLLHSPDYRTRYAADLKKALPRIPLVASAEDFCAFVDAGRGLMALHIGYESVDPYPLAETNTAPNGTTEVDRYRVTKMRHPGRGRTHDLSTLIYNAYITVTGIPPQAHEYLVGSRSALAWLIDRYKVSTDTASGIVNDPNAWGAEHGDPRYVLDLVKRIVTVSVRTVELVDALPPLVLTGEQDTPR